MRFRVIDERGAYMNRSPEIVRLELGPDSAVSKAFNIRSPVYELLVEGTEVDLPGDFIPGPHLEPLDDEARAAMAKYLRSSPGSTDPTSTLPLTGFNDAVQGQLNRLLAEAQQPRPDELTAMRAREAARDAQIAALMEQVAALTARTASPSRKTPL